MIAELVVTNVKPVQGKKDYWLVTLSPKDAKGAGALTITAHAQPAPVIGSVYGLQLSLRP